MKALIVANWKMHPATFKEAQLLFSATKRVAVKASATIVVAPPNIYLRELAKSYRGPIAFAAQNAHSQKEGAYTGEISLTQIKDAKATWIIIGHAERRSAGETDEQVHDKLVAALALGLKPVVCIGEAQRNAGGDYFDFVRNQLRIALKDLTPQALKKVVVAYEPVWAIGAPLPMSPHDMHEMAIFIRKTMVEMVGDAGHSVKIIYGGAIDETTAAPMLAQGDVAGLLVGRASTDARRFSALIASLSA